MNRRSIFINRNEIVSEYSCNSCYREVTGRYTINIILNGSSDYQIGRRELRLHPENLIFLNNTTTYSSKIDSISPVNSISVFFDSDFVRDFEYSKKQDGILLDNPLANNNTNPVFIEAIHPLKGSLRTSLLNLKILVESNSDNELLFNECLYDCLLNYHELYNSEVTNRTASLKFLSHATKSEILRRLSIARDYIISNYNKNIRLGDIAQIACLSVNHLLRTFKQAYQQSPHQFLTAFRLQQAKYYLKNTDYPVSEIVDIVGFECPSSFIRLFRSSFKVTPGQYR